MIVLGIDTATPGLSAALVGPEGTLASFAFEAGRRHTELLAPAIDDLCTAAGVELGHVDAFAVDIGPGLFTGLRVGLATAAALSSALGRPAVGLTSTEILAEPHRDAGRDVVAVVDVRRAEVAWAYYPAKGGPESNTPESKTPESNAPASTTPALTTPGRLPELLTALRRPAHELTVVGDGALRYREVLEAAGTAGEMIDSESPYPSAAVAAAIARRRLLEGSVTPGPLAPLYLRPADVRIGWASYDRPPGTTTHSSAQPAGRSRFSEEPV